jgi:hypothetical protein
MGITRKELDQLNYREDSEESADDFPFNYYLQFDEDNPWKIMVKIKGLDGDVVRFATGLFEYDDQEPDDR